MRVAVAFVAVLGVIACKRTVGSDGGRDQIREYLAAQFGSVDAVDCPSSVRAEPGGRYECTVRFTQGEAFTVAVTQLDDQGNVRFDLTERPVATEKLAPAIRDWFRQQSGSDANVDCGRGVRRFPAGGTYPCTATLADGSRRTVGVSLDTDGSYRWNLL